MVIVQGYICLDPVVIAKLCEWDKRLLTAVNEIPSMIDSPLAIRMRDLIRDALDEYRHWLSAQRQKKIDEPPR
jgi:hypothetical protein